MSDSLTPGSEPEPPSVADVLERLRLGGVAPATSAARADALRDAPVPAYQLADDAISAAQADQMLRSRRLYAVRALIEGNRRDAVALLLSWKSGMPDVRPAASAMLGLLDAAMVEVESAERGCGQPDGECLDPCHAGVLAPVVKA